MEYVNGKSLEELIREKGKLPDEVCSSIMILVSRALDYAHSLEVLIYGKTYHGVFHRDLKPANIHDFGKRRSTPDGFWDCQTD
jgi:serine/threonine protein kinase